MLEAAYTSVETRSAELYPFVLGVRSLVLDKYDSLAKIKNVHAPLLMLHGQRDEIIPLAHARTLFAAANDPKQMVVYPDLHHTDYSNGQIIVPLIDAVRKYKIV
jgi:pimeloyl-ACP methyl ester carboxylesterase